MSYAKWDMRPTMLPASRKPTPPRPMSVAYSRIEFVALVQPIKPGSRTKRWTLATKSQANQSKIPGARRRHRGTSSTAPFAPWIAVAARSRLVTSTHYGEEAVPDADPYSAIALSELQWLIHSARLARGQIAVDLGCGRGGPGRVLARSTGVRLIGIDFSIVGVTSAATRAAGIVPRPAYIACDARAIPLADHSVDAVISIDVLQLIPERELVLREVARVLRPAGFIAFSSWELIAEDENVPPRLRRLPRDYTAVAAAGLRVRDLQVPKGARAREEAFWANVTASADDLRHELGEKTATSVLGEASLANIFAESTRRVLCVAQS